MNFVGASYPSHVCMELGVSADKVGRHKVPERYNADEGDKKTPGKEDDSLVGELHGAQLLTVD